MQGVTQESSQHDDLEYREYMKNSSNFNRIHQEIYEANKPWVDKPWLLLMRKRLCRFLAKVQRFLYYLICDILWEILAKVNQKREVWRFLGFVSALVGFITFAITPPFTKLLDHGFWGGFGIVMYCALGISICCVMLGTPRWRVSKNKVLTAHVVFFVLMLTSVYSFFLDKMEGDKEKEGWQKLLNLISCGAFSLMSLSFSRLTGLGFEAGVFNFFLGGLMTAVMKWNWKFVFAVATFSYVLIIIRTLSDSQIEYWRDWSDSDKEGFSRVSDSDDDKKVRMPSRRHFSTNVENHDEIATISNDVQDHDEITNATISPNGEDFYKIV